MPAVPVSLKLVCPLRGPLNAPAKSADGLKPSEEARRIEAITFLLAKGYPAENIKVEATIKRFGHGGKNSFRADLAVLDVPVDSINAHDPDELLEHAVMLGEVKREHKSVEQVKETQVEPMLDFAHNDDCVALYWDDSEQRIYWRERVNGKIRKHNAPATTLPPFGTKVSVKPLTFEDILPSDSLLDVFERIEDVLHSAAVDPEARYGVILQLLLAKLYDENAHHGKPTAALSLQDFQALGTTGTAALKAANVTVDRAVAYYGKHLPRPVAKKLPITADTLFEVMELLAPIKITASSQDVIQTFYMHFAKHLYKWDLAQFFTPVTVTDFIATVLAPNFGEHIRDPACGSADFLTSAYRLGLRVDPNYAQCVWGADNSPNAVQVAILNMLLNGDGRSNIELEDSLEAVAKYADRYEMLICNPPFGTRIVETRRSVLRQFDLGHVWRAEAGNGGMEPTTELRGSQQVGILFAELCVRQAKPGGRIGIILPNGYLGNRSDTYLALREWLLRHCRVASICSFPRFTFKTSGADVSASVVFLEKRRKPVRTASKDGAYRFHVGLIESVGWQLGDKGAKPIYRRDPSDGAFLADTHGNRLLDSDFARVLTEIRTSSAAKRCKWLARSVRRPTGLSGWSVSADRVAKDRWLTMDPKRLSEKATDLRDQLLSVPHYRLGDLVEVIPQPPRAWREDHLYRYVQIDDIESGTYTWTSMRGWELPDRARHSAEPGELFVGGVWSSVQKWMLAGGDTADLIVTNGCHRLRMRKGKGRLLLDVVAALSTETYATQMRSLARGSDGLAEINMDEVGEVLIPKITNAKLRSELAPFVKQLEAGYTSVRAKVDDLISTGSLAVPVPAKRKSHTVQV
jgi:type I restriction enzyme M protein